MISEAWKGAGRGGDGLFNISEKLKGYAEGLHVWNYDEVNEKNA